MLAAGTPSLFTHKFQSIPCRCSRRVASIMERIDLDCGGNVLHALIGLTAALCEVSQEQGVSYSCKEPLS